MTVNRRGKRSLLYEWVNIWSSIVSDLLQESLRNIMIILEGGRGQNYFSL